jgi:hypothetical protein
VRRSHSFSQMTPFQIIRIGLCLAGIFLAGVWTGRLTAPQPIQQQQQNLPPLARVSQPADLSSEAFRRVDRVVHFTPEQRGKVLPIFDEISKEMVRHPPASPERYATFQQFKAKLEPYILPEQKVAFKNFCARSERFYENRLRGAAR